MVQPMDLDKGGRGAIERMVEAYGFTTRQALCEKLGISKSTLATRYMRDSFPSDWVIQCALETGVSLTWLTTGNGPIYDNAKTDVIAITKKKLIDGDLLDSNYLMFDKAFLPSTLKNPIVIIDDKITYIAEHSFDNITDGKWLVEIEGKKFVRDLIRIPVGKVKVLGGEITFDCGLDDISVIYKIIIKCISQF